MKLRLARLFTIIFSLIILFLAGTAGAAETGSLNVTPEIRAKIQNYIVQTAESNPDIYEISLHAMLNSGKTVRIGCTNLKKLNTPSDPEDVEAIILNQVIFIHEGEVYDYTVPLTNKQGQAYAVSGIKVKHKGEISQAEGKEIAIELARGIGKMVLSTQE